MALVPLTELGPYGVPISITLPLFQDGTPLRAVLAQGFVVTDCDLAGVVAILDKETGQYCLMHKTLGDVLFNVTAQSLHAVQEWQDADLAQMTYGTTVQNRNVRVTEMMAVVEFQTGETVTTELLVTDSPLVVDEDGFINLLDLEVVY